MKKFILLGIIAILSIAMIVLVFKTNGQNEMETKHSVSNDSELIQSSLPHASNSDGSVSSVLSVNNSDKLAPPIFQPIEQSNIRKYIIPDIFKNTEDGFLFALDHQKIESLKEGDQFQMQMLKLGVNRKGTINSIEKLDDDIKRWRGSFDGYDSNSNYFTITQTQKDSYAIIKVFTDKGVFIAEIKDGIGLASTAPTAPTAPPITENDSIRPNG